MLDVILLVLLGATAISFIALTLDEVTRRSEVRASNWTSPVQPNGLSSQPTIEPVTKDDEERQAA